MGGDPPAQQYGTPPREGDQESEGASQRALRALEPDRGRTATSPPPRTVARTKREWPSKRGRGRGTPHPAALAHGVQRGQGGATLIAPDWDPPVQQGPGQGSAPQPQQCAQTARGQEGAGDKPRAPTARGTSTDEGGTPPNSSVRSKLMACPRGRRGTPRARRKKRTKRGHPPSSVCSQCTAWREGGDP